MKDRKKTFKLIRNIIFAVLISFFAYVLLSSIISVSKNGIPKVFGRSVFIVETESMDGSDEFYLEHPEYKGKIKAGDMVITNDSIEMDDIKVGDIITFLCVDDTQIIYGKPITHRVIEIITNEDNSIEFVTKGDNNPIEDDYRVKKDNYIGKVVNTSHFIGSIISFVTSSKKLYIFIIILVIVGYIATLEIKSLINTKKEIKEEKKKQEIEDLRKELLEEIKKEQELQNEKENTNI